MAHGLCAVAVAVGLIPYAHVPLAAASHPYWNWVGVSSLGDLLALVTRQTYGTGQLASQGIFQGGSPENRLGAWLGSFTALELALAVLGWIAAYRTHRWYAWFAALAFVVAGPAFVAYANINLATPGARFILERFFLLSHVAAAPLIALGFALVVQVAQPGSGASAWARGALATAILLVVGLTVIVASPGVDQSSNHVARNFGEDVLASLPADGVLLVNGDETAFPVGYLQAVEAQRPDVTMVMMGLLGSDWYVHQLREPRARLQVPFARHDGRTETLAALIAANPDRPFALVGPPVDDTIRQGYFVYGPGLVGEIRQPGAAVPIAQFVEDAERLYARYRVPALSGVKAGTFERGVVTQYAGGPYRVGAELERAGRRDDARAWYQRALAIDPELGPARDGLARLGA